MIQDIKRPKKSLREVLPPQGRIAAVRQVYQDAPPGRREPERRGRGPIVFLAIAAGVLVAVVFFLISNLLAEATVTLVTKQATISLQAAGGAIKTPAALPAVPAGKLAFDLMITPALGEKEVLTASSLQNVSERASGRLLISNNYSSASQKLVANTRFADSQGRIYRIREAITVPGMGTVEAVVYADGPGESYNQSAGATFTIPGFRGDPRYQKFSAKAQTPLAGGLVGQRRVVAPELLAQARASLLERVSTRLQDSARFQLPAEFILYDDAMFIEVVEESQQPAGAEGAVELSISARLAGVILERAALSRWVVAGRRPEFETLDFTITNLDDLNFSLANRSAFKPAESSEISFNLGGEAQVKAVVDEVELAERLTGQTRQQAVALLRQWPAIESATMNFKLPWQRRFPQSPERILIKS